MLLKHYLDASLARVLFVFFILNASAYADQSVSLSWLSYEEVIENENGRATFEPQEYELLYSAGISEYYDLSLRYWQGADTTEFRTNVDLERELSGWQVRVTRYLQSETLAGMWVDISVGVNRATIESVSPLVNSGYEEENESREISFGLGHDLEWGQWLLTPSIQLAYQQSKSRFYRERLGILRDLDFDTEEEGAYGQVGLGLTRYWEPSEASLLTTGVSFAWVEGISGDGISRARGSVVIRSQSINETFDLEDELESEVDGAGSVTFQASIFLGGHDVLSYGFDVSVTEPVNQDSLGTLTQVGVSLYF